MPLPLPSYYIVETEEVYSQLVVKIKLNRSLGPDGIAHKILNDMTCYLAVPLAGITNSSLCQGTVPDQWKTGDKQFLWSKAKFDYFITTCAVECYWHCSDGIVHYKSDEMVNFCGFPFRCATLSPITVFINFVFYFKNNSGSKKHVESDVRPIAVTNAIATIAEKFVCILTILTINIQTLASLAVFMVDLPLMPC